MPHAGEGAIGVDALPDAGDYGLAAAIERQAWGEVASVVAHRATELVVVSGLLPLVITGLSSMPAEAIAQHPELLVYREFLGLVNESEPSYRPSLPRLRAGGESAELEMRAISTALLGYRLQGRLAQAVELADSVTPAVRTALSRWGARAEGAAAAFFTQAANTHALVDDLGLAERLLLEAWSWRHVDVLGFVAHEVGGKLGALAAMRGNNRDATDWIGQAMAYRARVDDRIDDVPKFAAPLAEFINAVDRLDLPTVESMLPRLPRLTRGFEFLHWVLWAQVHHLLLTGQPREALRAIDQTPLSDGPGQRGMADRLRVDVLLALGFAEPAQALLGDLGETNHVRLQRARLAVLALDHDTALAHLDGLREPLTRRDHLEAMALEASCLLALGRRIQARDVFAELLNSIDDTLSVVATISVDSAKTLFALCRQHPPAPLENLWRRRTTAAVLPRQSKVVPSQDIALTDREVTMLRHLAAGASRAGIARRELVSINTVKSQIASLYRKLGVTSSREALVRARSLGWL